MGVFNLLRTLRRAWSLYRDGAPLELCRGYPVLIEQRLTSDHPVPLVCQPDAVFALACGDLVVTETKFRSSFSVTAGDVLQMSVAATVLRHTTDARVQGRTVRSYGYMRIVHRGTAAYRRVTLLPDAAVRLAWFACWAQRADRTSAA